jgi:deoxyribodipyrimidine photo-lyase
LPFKNFPMPSGAEAFLEQLVVWRELAFNMAAKRPADFDRYASLPAWAQATLAAHTDDPRPHVYTPRALEAAETHDAWGKKILEWSPSPERALDTMVELMNRWSLDGRDPNSDAGYFWVLGRYDRPWPERPVFGTVRSMTSESAGRKLRLARYLSRDSA